MSGAVEPNLLSAGKHHSHDEHRAGKNENVFVEM
jgi:hypothetical protein